MTSETIVAKQGEIAITLPAPPEGQEWHRVGVPWPDSPWIDPNVIVPVTMDSRIQAAVAAERERCARVALLCGVPLSCDPERRFESGFEAACKEIAERIRSRE